MHYLYSLAHDISKLHYLYKAKIRISNMIKLATQALLQTQQNLSEPQTGIEPATFWLYMVLLYILYILYIYYYYILLYGTSYFRQNRVLWLATTRHVPVRNFPY